MTRRRLMCSFCALSLLLFTAAACGDAMLTDTPTAGVLRDEQTGPIPLGAPFSIPVPASNGTGVGGTEWVKTDFVIPEGKWAHVRVIGGVSYAANPNCYYASGPCDRSLDGMTTGPLFHGGASHVRVGYQVAGQPAPNPHGSMAEFGMYPVGGSEQTAMESAVLVNAYRPFQLWTRRVIVSGGTWDPFSGSSGAQYFLAPGVMGQRLEVTIIPTPLKVGGPETVEPGKPAQFTADIVGPFEFRRQTPWGDSIQWQYYPGDTLPEPNRYLGGTYLYECTNKPTCSYTPTRNGRMGVHAWVQYNHLEVRSAVVRIDSARLKLSCSERVPRGGEITCTARAEPSGELEVLGWAFVGGGRTIQRPNSESGSTEWKGVMVISGVITVTGRVNGEDRSDTARIEVLDRTDWPGIAYPAAPEPTRSSELPYPPVNQPAGERSHGVLGRYTIERVYGGKLGVGSGPNANWWFFREPPTFENPVIHVNPGLYTDDPFFRAQTGGPFCDREFMVRTRRQVERHERRHHDISAAYWSADSASAALERTTMYYTGSDIDELAQGLLAFLDGPLQEEQAKFDRGDIVRVTCTFNMNFRQER